KNCSLSPIFCALSRLHFADRPYNTWLRLPKTHTFTTNFPVEEIVRNLLALAALLCMAVCVQAFGQSTYATVSGTIEDSSHALLPGVMVTATNNATGVVTSVISNESGAYNLTSLLPGTYSLKAELPGFQTKTFTDVQLGNAAQVRLNFALQVA